MNSRRKIGAGWGGLPDTRLRLRVLRALAVLAVLCAALCAVSCAKAEAAAETTVDTTTVYTLTYISNNEKAGRIFGEKEQKLTSLDASTEVKAIERDGYVFVRWSDGVTNFVRSGDHVTANTTITAIFDYQRLDLPIVDIDTGGNAIASKTEYIKCQFVATGGESGNIDATGQIRGRGNATWDMEKKSYRLKFDEKQNPLDIGSGKARNFVLLANHCDQSLLRDWTAFKLGKLLDNLPYVTGSTLVDLYLNGHYQGVYQLCEQPDDASSRVDLGQATDDLDIGYFIELDMYATRGDDGEEMSRQEIADSLTIFSANGHPYSIKSKVTTKEQRDYIKAYVSSVTDALRAGDEASIESLIDIGSCVDMYLLEEYVKNIDVGWSSFFMYKPAGGKLYFGPPWDFDLAMGNDYRLDDGSYENIYVGDGSYGFSQANRWFILLCKLDWFEAKVKARWDEKKAEIAALTDEVEAYGTSIKRSANRNFTRWNIWGQRIKSEPDYVLQIHKYSGMLDYLTGWLRSRWEWLDKYWG